MTFDPGAVIASVIGAVILLGGQQWMLHKQNRKDAKDREARDLAKDNRLAVLLENFPLHLHQDHDGIHYAYGMDPRVPRIRRD
jgi:hypothetical protein